MQAIRKHIPFFLAAILLWLFVGAVYPYYQYYVDPDATGYLTIVKRYARGEWLYAVNGYWSPWACWLAALMVKGGTDIMASAVIVNTAGATGFLCITHSLLQRFNSSRRMVWVVNITLAIFLCYGVYKQLFDDLWGAFFLLCVLRIMLAQRFTGKPLLWISIGIIGAFAFVAKAYAFPFFILSVLVCGFVVTNAARKENRIQWLKISATAIIVMIVCSMPWIYALHWKYGTWMTGTAGKLNLSWYVVGHPFWQESIHTLIPVPYADSPYYWEDPYLVNGPTPHFWDSLAMLKLQLVRIPYNFIKFLNSIHEFSPLFFLIVLLSIAILVSKKLQNLAPAGIKIAIVSMLLFPLAFMLMNFEARYIWYMLPVGIIVGAWALEQALAYLQLKRSMQYVFIGLFAFSFISYPVWDMKAMYRLGQEDHTIAKALQQASIKGTFTSNAVPGPETQSVIRIAYFSGNSYFTQPYPDKSWNEVSADIQRYDVKYYYYRSPAQEGDHYQLLDNSGRPYPVAFQNPELGIKIFKMN